MIFYILWNYRFCYKEMKDNPEKRDESLEMLYEKRIQIIDQYRIDLSTARVNDS